jgi:opacity protein-like surface antigen
MKTLSLAVAAWLAGAGAALAQAPSPADAVPDLPRADAHFVIGWQNLHKNQPENSSNDWLNNIFYAGGGAGWYWTDHVKTQVDFGAGTRSRQYRYRQYSVNGFPAFESSRVAIQQQSLAVAQQYQFFRNQWFHPHVGGGLELARETSTENYDPVFVYDNSSRTSVQLTPAHTEGPGHKFIARPFAQTGFKAYMTRRAFFTTDARVMFRSGIDEVLFRFGFGVDF